MTATWLKTSSEAEAVYLLWIEEGKWATWLNMNKVIFITTYRELLHRSLQLRPPCIPFTCHGDLSKGIQSTVQPTPIRIWSAELPSGLYHLQREPTMAFSKEGCRHQHFLRWVPLQMTRQCTPVRCAQKEAARKKNGTGKRQEWKRGNTNWNTLFDVTAGSKAGTNICSWLI